MTHEFVLPRTDAGNSLTVGRQAAILKHHMALNSATHLLQYCRVLRATLPQCNTLVIGCPLNEGSTPLRTNAACPHHPYMPLAVAAGASGDRGLPADTTSGVDSEGVGGWQAVTARRCPQQCQRCLFIGGAPAFTPYLSPMPLQLSRWLPGCLWDQLPTTATSHGTTERPASGVQVVAVLV